MAPASLLTLAGGTWLAAPSWWTLPVLLAAALLLALGLMGERGLARRGRGLARVARSVAWTVAVGALALLVLRPQRRAPASESGATLWTDGRLASAAPAAGREFVLAPAADPGVPSEGVEPLADARALWRRLPALTTLAVRGHGLEAFDWQGFGGRVEFSPSPLPPGVVRALWNRRLALGDRLEVEGAVELGGLASPEVKLVLDGPAGIEDAVVLRRAAGPVAFALAALPRATGPVLYTLRGLDAAGVERFAETVDAAVEAPRLPSVLVLESAPRFETRFLKEWLAGEGGRIAVRSTVSKDRRRSETPGVPAPEGEAGGEDAAASASAAAVNAAGLAPFDAVVADPAALAALSPGERRALGQAIDDGCGLLVALPRGAPAPALDVLPASPAVKAVADLELLAARPTWPGAPLLPPLDIAARELGECAACAPLVEDASGRALAVARPSGRGTVAWTVLHDTYRYVLEGNATAHRALWSRLLSAVARPSAVRGRWLAPAQPIVVDRPLELILLTSEPRPTATLDDGDGSSQLALRQDELEPTRWSATLWPRRAAWQTVRAGSGDTLNFAAAPRSGWSAWQAGERQEATRRRALVEPAARAAAPVAAPWRPLPRWPFFALLLAGLGWLWIDERLRG